MIYNKKDNRTNTWDYYCVEDISKNNINFGILPENDIYHKNLYSGYLILKITCKSNFFIGSGEVEIYKNRHYILFSRVGNRNVIPGSSLKGGIRTYLEAISRSCINQNCRDNLCPACRIFGALDYSGRVFFEDGTLIKFGKNGKSIITIITQRFSPRLICEGRKFYYFDHPQISHFNSKRNEQIEIIPKDSIFTFNINFINLESWELGLLLISMGLDKNHPFDLKIGGAKNRQCGRIKIDLDFNKSYVFNMKNKYIKRITKEDNIIEKININEIKSICINNYWEKCEEWKIKEKVEIIINKFNRGNPDEIKR